jgi:hypothetical protein
MSAMKRTALLLALCLLPALMTGCLRSNTVKLTYKTAEMPITCPGNAVVYKFEDQRKMKDQLGWHQDGKPVLANSDVGGWIGWAVFDELMAAGCETKYRTTIVPTDVAIVTGEVLEVALNQTGKTTFRARVALNIRVQKDGKDVYVEKFISEVEDIAMPGYGSQSDILAAALKGAIETALPVICENL